MISLIEAIVKERFSNKQGNGYVGIKIYGSIATDLAIETSDVDLVVTGLNYSNKEGRSREQLIKVMQRLYDCLVPLQNDNKIDDIHFLSSATVPIIKLVANLEVINQIQMEKAMDRARLEKKMEAKRKGLPSDTKVELDFQALGIDAK